MTGLSDKHPYVRRTAVMGVLKIWHMSADTVNHTGMVEQVRTMLYQDTDPQVVTNCLQVRLWGGGGGGGGEETWVGGWVGEAARWESSCEGAQRCAAFD